MTITEANAVNAVCREAIALAKKGVEISPVMECEIAKLLINAHKAIKAGFDPKSFLSDLAAARRLGIRERGAKA